MQRLNVEGGAAAQLREEFEEMKIGVVFDELMLLHKEKKQGHPERPERLMAIYMNLVKKGLFEKLVRIEYKEALDDDLLLIHT